MTDSSAHDAAAPPVKKRWRLPVLLLVAVVSVATIGSWLLATSPGLRWLAATATQTSGGSIALTGVSGTFLGTISVQTLGIGPSDLRITAQDVKLDWQAAALLRGKLKIALLQARDVEVLSLPTPYPQDLRPPLPFSIDKLDIGALRVLSEEGGSPDFSTSNLAARLESDGQHYKLQDLHAGTEYGTLTVSGQMDGSRPFALQAQAELAGLVNFASAEHTKNAQDAHVSAIASGDLQKLTISAKGYGAGLDGNAEAQLAPYGDFLLTALQLHVNGLDPHAFSPNAPKANLALQADLRTNTSGLLEGEVSAKNFIPAPLDHDGLPLLSAHAHAILSVGRLKFDKLALMLAGGASLSGDIDWQRTQAKGSGDLAISHLDPSALDTRLRKARLNGSMKLSGDSDTQQGVLMLSDGDLHLDALLIKSNETLLLDKLRLARGQAALTGQGKLALNGKRSYHFEGKLHRFDLAAFMSAPHSDLNAQLESSGELDPQLSGKASFVMIDSNLSGHPVSGNGRIEFVGTRRGKIDGEFSLGDNHLTAKGGYGAGAEQLRLTLSAPALQQLGSGFSGSLTAHATLAGSLTHPDASLTAEGRNLATPDDHHLTSFSANVEVRGEAVTLNVKAGDYRSGPDASTVLTPDFKNLEIAVHGSRSLHEIGASALLSNGSELALQAKGGLSELNKGWRNMQWRGALTALSGAGALPFKLLADTPLTVGTDHVSLDAAAFSITGGQLRIDSLAWSPQRWSSKGSFTGIGVRAGVGLKPSFTLRKGREFMRMGGDWDIASTSQLLGSLHMARESGDWVLPGEPRTPLGLKTLEVTARAEHGRISAELSALGDRLGEWHGNIAMPLDQSGSGWTIAARAPLSGKIHVNATDLSWLGAALNNDITTAGRLLLNADISGTYASPRLLGQMRGDELAVALLDQGIRLEQGTLLARFDQKALHIDSLSFLAPHDPQPRDNLLTGLSLSPEPGTLTASGTIDLSGDKGDLEIRATHLPLSQRPDRWIIASGSGGVRINNDSLSLNADITADAGLINQPINDKPQLSEDIVISGRRPVMRKGPRISVDATLNLGEHFYLRASGLEARLAGKLSMRDTPGQQLRVSGTIAARDASFAAYGQKLTVERGIVNFQGPLSDPGLNILALRKGLSVEAGVEVTGTALRPAVRLVSTPSVPDFEKLSWIILGRPPNAGGTDASLLLTAATSIMGGRSGGLTGQIKQTLGIDELSLRQSENTGAQPATDNPLSSQIATVGKRLSANAVLSYERGVTAVAGVTKLTYSLTPRVNIITQSGVESAIDIFYTFSFD